LFYRLLQRSSNVYLYYNSEPDDLGTSEMSRFLRQVNVELKLPIQKRVLSNKIQLKGGSAITFPQNDVSKKFLAKFLLGEKPLSPTTLNDYIECKLRFYLKHIAGYREADEVEEGLDARIFGNLLHKVLFLVYNERKQAGGELVKSDFETMKAQLPKFLDRAFREQYGLAADRPVDYDGPWLVMREIIQDFAQAVLRKDEAVAPLEIVSLETEVKVPFEIQVDGKFQNIWIGGKIDRVDSISTGLRIIDYKTGKDEGLFSSVESLFNAGTKRNKAAFQTLYYALVAKRANKTYIGPIWPGLYNKQTLFRDQKFGLSMNRNLVNANDLLPEYEAKLKSLLTELYAESSMFSQTENKKNCEYCSFKSLCRR
jgi:CRISPR/Cas system-associated exonuclease Cas4 (RecB family)